MEEQMQALVTTLQGFMATLQAQNRNAAAPPQPQPPTVDQLLQHQHLHFESFDEASESFEAYSQRLNNYFHLKGLTGATPDVDHAKVRVLINCLGARHYQRLANITSPDLPETKGYDDLITLLKDNFTPKRNILTEQHTFFSREQQQGESLKDFINNLNELARNAEFVSHCKDEQCTKELSKTMIRVQFIRGMADPDIREPILMLGTATLDDIKDKALTIESSRIQNRQSFNARAQAVQRITSSNNSRQNRSQSRTQSRSRNRGRNRSRQPRSSRAARSSTTSRRVDLRQLGLEGLCLHCGKNNHPTRECRSTANLKCTDCNKNGHLAKVCITTLMQRQAQPAPQQTTTTQAGSDVNMMYTTVIPDETFSAFNYIRDFLTISNMQDDDKIYAEIKLNDVAMVFECDSGARHSVLNIQDYNQLGLREPMKPSAIRFKTATGEVFSPLGYVTLTAVFRNRSAKVDLYLCDRTIPPLLGREWIRLLNIDLREIDSYQVNNISNTSISDSQSFLTDITRKYSDVFEAKVGCVPNYKVSLQLKDDASPVFLKAREVPYALRDEVERELDRLEAEGVITKTDYTEWGTPIVVIPKPDGSVRICADYKVTVNPQLKDSGYPIPRIEDIFNRMRGGKYFTTLDLHKAYLHLPVDEASAKIQTITTHKGSYLVNRLAFGIKTAPNEFHKFMAQFTHDLHGSGHFFDDLILQGGDIAEHKQRLIAALDKCRAHNLPVGLKKCQFLQERIQYLGHTISSEGLHKNPAKVQAIIDAPRPANKTDVYGFLGLLNYYAKFIPDAAEIRHPLNQLLRQDVPFHWTEECEQAFNRAKQEISSPRVLTPYDPSLPLILATDASPYGLSGVLSHRLPNGDEKPIFFISRSLTQSEKNYSQLDKEATAVYWACKKFFNYIYGRKFTLIVDNKPMMTILHPEKKLPPLTAARLLNYAVFLSGLDYKIEHKRSEDHANADYFSRNPVKTVTHPASNCVDTAYATQEYVIN